MYWRVTIEPKPESTLKPWTKDLRGYGTPSLEEAVSIALEYAPTWAHQRVVYRLIAEKVGDLTHD